MAQPPAGDDGAPMEACGAPEASVVEAKAAALPPISAPAKSPKRGLAFLNAQAWARSRDSPEPRGDEFDVREPSPSYSRCSACGVGWRPFALSPTRGSRDAQTPRSIVSFFSGNAPRSSMDSPRSHLSNRSGHASPSSVSIPDDTFAPWKERHVGRSTTFGNAHDDDDDHDRGMERSTADLPEEMHRPLATLEDVLINELRPDAPVDDRREGSETRGSMQNRQPEEALRVSASSSQRGAGVSSFPVAPRWSQHSSDGDGRGSELVGMRWSHFHPDNIFHTSHGRMLTNKVSHFVGTVIESRAWSATFMSLTVYALFALDLDQLFGNKESRVAVSIVTTAVFLAFVVELAMQSVGKPRYVCRAYFWLDLVALLSLLPDTWFVQVMIAGNDGAFAAGRSSRVARIMRIVARSVKATRMNRLTRIVRVATLLPRIMVVFGRQVREEETQKILNRKLRKIFAFLDEDFDGHITREEMEQCLAKLRAHTDSNHACAGEKSSTSLSCSKTVNSVDLGSGGDDASTFECAVRSARSGSTVSLGSEAERLVNFNEFKLCVMDDERIKNRMMSVCRQQVGRANNMQNIGSRHSEDVGVKVALGVLLTLLVLGVLEPTADDNSSILGLEFLDRHVLYRNSTWSDNTWSDHLREHVSIWEGQVAQTPSGYMKLLYLDIERKVYCNELAIDGERGQSCSAPRDTPLTWFPRGTLQQLDDDLFSSRFRFVDLKILRVLTDASIDVDEALEEVLEANTVTSAVLYQRDSVQISALFSIITTIFVIFLIFTGITLLTRDMNYLSNWLLKPLRSLADEMQSIVQLQFSALSMDVQETEKSVAEIRMVQRIFGNMKKAIKSWGKYVPWPVVRILLHAGVDASPGVRTREVTIFFSDIAGFTTIVEHLPPESSLLLLSRYFKEMSQVIDDNQGIVMEFIGDAILAVFGAPLKNPEHPTACVRAALGMVMALDKLNQWGSGKDLPQISIRCGVHTGRVLIGNMGFHSRLKYGMVGRQAAVPDRLEELNKTYGTNILISYATFSRIIEDSFVVRPVDYVKLSAGTEPEPVFEVMLPKERVRAGRTKMRAVALKYRRALKCYREADFAKALGLFKEVDEEIVNLTGVEHDPPSRLMIQRCEALIANPRENWDGAVEQA